MQAVVIHEHGGPETLRLQEHPTPEPRADEVRIAVRAVGLNHLDTWVRRGVPGHQFPLPTPVAVSTRSRGTHQSLVPPFPGRTPPTTAVPTAMARSAMRVAVLPVRP